MTFMLFHSFQFLLFLPILFVAYWFIPLSNIMRKCLLLAASMLFYMAWNPFPVVFLLYLSFVDWWVARQLQRSQAPSTRKTLLVISIVNNVGMLATFKYADWFAQSTTEVLSELGIRLTYAPMNLAMPIGLSFLVFQGMSYTIDVYRRELVAKDSILDVTLFLTFFPHVVAGPIVRASDFIPQLEGKKTLKDRDAGVALFRIAQGMVKKVVVADFLGANLVNRVFADVGNYSGLEVVVAVLAYTLQIYFDFSAYSDIAIGAARLFGYELKENFDKPYLAVSLNDFWRRWHMSLGSWLRDYLYIPLGGNRDGHARSMLHLLITMTVGGLWHGAHGRFVLWGFLHGIGLVLSRTYAQHFGRWPRTRLVQGVSMLLTFVVVVELRILFRARDVHDAWIIFLAQFHKWSSAGLATNLSMSMMGVMAMAMVGHVLPHKFYQVCAQRFASLPWWLWSLLLVGLGWGLQQVAQVEAQPYIYAQF
jgi:alginate O-acetyltransferase complex protein AlgI